MFNVLDQFEAEKDLSPLHETFVNGFDESFMALNKIQNSIQGLEIRTRADIVRTVTLNCYRKKGLKIHENDSIDHHFVVVNNKIILRIKKLDETKAANFNDTWSSNEFINGQYAFDGMLNQHSCLVLGYIPDSTWTSYKGIYIVEPTRVWSYQITTKIQMIKAIDTEDVMTPKIKIKASKKGKGTLNE